MAVVILHYFNIVENEQKILKYLKLIAVFHIQIKTDSIKTGFCFERLADFSLTKSLAHKTQFG